MPRARKLIAKAEAASELILPVEWELTLWQGLRIAGLDLPGIEAFQSAWAEHRVALLDHWRKTMPGQRPWGAYVTGELPPPPIVEEPFLHDIVRAVGDVVWHPYRCYDELSHLIELGELDARERREALAREEAGTYSHSRYRWLGKRQEQGRANGDSAATEH
jgi:hypothetical protein